MAQWVLADQGVSDATKSTRDAQAKRYKRFCIMFNLIPFPASADQAGLYATYLQSEKFTPVSIRNYVSGVWYSQKMLGFSDCSGDFLLKQTLNGIERAFDPSKKVVRYPFTPQDLLRIFNMLDMSDINDVLFWLAVLLGYRCLLRACHMTDSPHSIGVSSLSLSEKYIRIRIITSKTDQFAREDFSVFLQDMPGSPWCARPLINKLLIAASPSDPLFCCRVGGVYFPIYL